MRDEAGVRERQGHGVGPIEAKSGEQPRIRCCHGRVLARRSQGQLMTRASQNLVAGEQG